MGIILLTTVLVVITASVVFLIVQLLFGDVNIWVYILVYVGLLIIWGKSVLVLYHSIRAGHMLKQGDFEQVSASYEAIARLKKNDGYGDYAQGLAEYYGKQYGNAQKSLEHALEKGIRTQKKQIEPLAKLLLLVIYMERKKWEKATKVMAEMDRALQGGKKIPSTLRPLLYSIKGEYYYHNGQFEQGIRAFEKAFAADSRLVGEEAYYYALMLEESGDTDQAKAIIGTLSDDHTSKLFRISKKQVTQLQSRISNSEQSTE